MSGTGRPDLVALVRPMLRCLRDDLNMPIPSARLPLEAIDHPLLAKAGEQFADPDTPHERIRAIDDIVLHKVKVGRWRGAVYRDGAAEAEVPAWLTESSWIRKPPPACWTRTLERDAPVRNSEREVSTKSAR